MLEEADCRVTEADALFPSTWVMCLGRLFSGETGKIQREWMGALRHGCEATQNKKWNLNRKEDRNKTWRKLEIDFKSCFDGWIDFFHRATRNHPEQIDTYSTSIQCLNQMSDVRTFFFCAWSFPRFPAHCTYCTLFGILFQKTWRQNCKNIQKPSSKQQTFLIRELLLAQARPTIYQNKTMRKYA